MSTTCSKASTHDLLTELVNRPNAPEDIEPALYSTIRVYAKLALDDEFEIDAKTREVLAMEATKVDHEGWSAWDVADYALSTAWLHTNQFWHFHLLRCGFTILRLIGKQPRVKKPADTTSLRHKVVIPPAKTGPRKRPVT